MADIPPNPALEVEPNYQNPVFASLRESLFAKSWLSDEEAVNNMLEIWRADREQRVQRWQEQHGQNHGEWKQISTTERC